MEQEGALVKTPHGHVRAAQRGVSDARLLFLLRYGSTKYHRGRVIHYMMQCDIDDLLRNDLITRQEVDKLKNLCLVTNSDDEVVTVYRPTKAKWKRIRCF